MKLSHFRMSMQDLTPHPKNVRQGNLKAIKESLDVHGQYRPIVVQKSTNYIIAGNHTYMAASELGWTEIDATVIDVDDKQAIQIMLVDNRSSELASNNESALLELLQGLNDDILGSGYDLDDVEDLIFKVEGSLGTIADGISVSERKEDYEARGIKSIVLPFDQSDYEELLPILTEVRQFMQLATNSEIFSALVFEKYESMS